MKIVSARDDGLGDYTVNQEEIIFGDNLYIAKKITLSDNQIHEGHREWLKNLFDKHSKPNK